MTTIRACSRWPGCVVDHSPPPPPREHAPGVFVRERGAGRPTKRDRRQLDRFRTP
jgi:ribosome-associated heat shock protein Hsp15